MSLSVHVGSPAHVNPNSDTAVGLHASACNALQRALRELRSTDTDYSRAAVQAKAALDAIRTLGLIDYFTQVVQ